MLGPKAKARLLRNFLRNAQALPLVSSAQPMADGLFSEINPVYLKKPGLSPGLMGMGSTGFFAGFICTVVLLPVNIVLALDSEFTADFVGLIYLGLAIPACAFFSYWWLKGLFFGRAPAPTYFNRKNGMVYFSYYGEPRTVPFDELVPMVNTGRVVGPGLASFCNLSLVHLQQGEGPVEERALCNIGISGMQSTSAVCQAQWAFIRAYMKGDAPDRLPKVKLLQDKADWVMWMADVVDWVSMVTGPVMWVGHINEFLLLFVYPPQALPTEAHSSCTYEPQRDGANGFQQEGPVKTLDRSVLAGLKAIVVAAYTIAGVWLYATVAPHFIEALIEMANGKG